MTYQVFVWYDDELPIDKRSSYKAVANKRSRHGAGAGTVGTPEVVGSDLWTEYSVEAATMAEARSTAIDMHMEFCRETP